jgi:hypothetical protein
MAVHRFAEAEGLEIAFEYVEAETGKAPTRSTGGPSSPRPYLRRG